MPPVTIIVKPKNRDPARYPDIMVPINLAGTLFTALFAANPDYAANVQRGGMSPWDQMTAPAVNAGYRMKNERACVASLIGGASTYEGTEAPVLARAIAARDTTPCSYSTLPAA